MLVASVEGQEDFSVPFLGQLDAVGVERGFKQGDDHAGQEVALAEGVGDAALLPGMYFSDD